MLDTRLVIVFAIVLACLSGGLAHAAEPVSFRADIAPILVRKCQTCHGPKKAKADYRLDTFTRLITPGRSKLDAVKPGEPDESELYVLLTLDDPDERMPHESDPLPPQQIDVIKRWIAEGAKYDADDRDASIASIVPVPTHPNPPDVYTAALPITAMAFSPDGATLAAAGYHEVTLWNPTTGKMTRRLPGVAQRTFALEFSGDGKLLAVGGGTPGEFGEVRVIDAITGEPRRVYGPYEDVVLDVAFSPDGASLTVAGADHAIRIYDLNTGSLTLTIDAHSDWVTAIDFDAEGKRLASASRDKSAKVLDAKTGELLTLYNDHGEPVYGVSFTPDAKSVVSADAKGRTHVWQADEAKKTGDINGVAPQMYKLVTLDKHVYVYGRDHAVRQHTLSNRKETRRYEGHGERVYGLAIHAATNRIAAGAYDGRVIVWAIDTGEKLAEFIAAPGLAE